MRTISGQGSALSFELRGGEPGKPAVLEIQEIHNRRPEVFGYTVLVNDREVYFRSYEELGTGPNHYFIHVPAELITNDAVRVTLRNEGSSQFSIGHVWFYSDFFNQLAVQERIYRPMAFYIETYNAFPNVKAPLEQWNQYKQAYSGLSCYAAPGVHVSSLSYASQDFSRLTGVVDQSLELLGKTGMGAQFLFNATAWGGAMQGPDGMGNYFGDMQYSQVSVNPVTGAMNPSVPNMWSNVMSTTYANPHYNEVLRIKFAKLLRYFTDRVAFQSAHGNLPAAEFNFARELGIDYIRNGDFQPEYIKAAARDGVRLDPRAGLDSKAREWMFNNVSRIFDWMGKDFAQALGRNPICVDRGTLHLPTQQYADNLFGHTNASWPLSVLRSRRWLGWQNGVTPEFWSSGEHGTGDDSLGRVRDDYLRSRGKLTMINRERHSLKEDFSYNKNLYQQGYLYQAFYDTHPGDEKLFQAADHFDNAPSLPAVHFEPYCLDVDLNRDLLLGPAEQIVSSDNLTAHATPCWHQCNKMVVQDIRRPGSVVYRLTNRGAEFPSGLSVAMMGRIAPGEANWIEIAAGTSPDQLKVIKKLQSQDLPYPANWTMHQTTETKIPLGDESQGSKEYYLRLSFHSEKAFDAAFLHELRVGMSWTRKSGQLMGDSFNCGQSRILNLWTQDRAVSQRMLDNYRNLGGEDAVWSKARALFDQGLYRSAYAELVGEFSQLLPARYAIRGHGALGKHPVFVKLNSDDSVAVVDLEKLGPSGARFGIKAESETTVQITFSALKNGRAYVCKALGDNRYEVAAVSGENAPGSCLSVKGSVNFELLFKPENRSKLPREFSGIYLSGNKGKIKVELGDLKLSDYNGYVELPVAKGAAVSRSAQMLEAPASVKAENWPQPMDRVDVTLDEEGKVIGLKASYGLNRGRIKSFTPPSFEPPSNGVIELEDGERYELNLTTQCDTLFYHAEIRQYEVANLPTAFKPGEFIELTYSPYTYAGRLPRVLSLTQPYEVLMDENYQKMTGDDWKKKPVAIEKAVWEPHAIDPSYMPDYIFNTLYPAEPFTPGSVVYKIESKAPLGRTLVEFMGRLFEDSTKVEFFISPDQKQWVKCGQFDNSFLNFMPLRFPDKGPWNFFDLSDQVKGRNGFYLKVQLTRHADDHRLGLMRVRVVTGKP